MDEIWKHLGKLDPDSKQNSSAQIAAQIRVEVLTDRVPPGKELPSNQELQTHYTVARETVKRAIKILEGEQLVVTQQGKNPKVKAKTRRSVELRPYLEAAFASENVEIEFAGFTSETLKGVLGEILDKVRMGQYQPNTITLKVLISDTSQPLAVPALAETGRDDEMVRERATKITSRAIETLNDELIELQSLGHVAEVSLQVRTHGIAPTFKAFILNQSEVFYGFYPIVEHAVLINGDPTSIYDPMGKDAPLIHYSLTSDPSVQSIEFIKSLRVWFDSVWDTIAQEYEWKTEKLQQNSEVSKPCSSISTGPYAEYFLNIRLRKQQKRCWQKPL